MTKCSVDLSCNSRLLLKVLTCLWDKFIRDQTQYTQIYQAQPTNEGYLEMAEELGFRFGAVTSSFAVNKLSICIPQTSTYFELIVSDAYGNTVYYQTDAPVVFEHNENTFANAASDNITPELNNGDFKPVQKLNVDECVEIVYQIAPVYLEGESEGSYVSATKATITARTGCAGIANTGFITLSVIVDNNCYQVPSCVRESCNKA